MNIVKNKFFLLGNLAFLLLVIPVVLYFVKNQTSTTGSAAATTTLSFNPPSLSLDQCTATQTTRLILNPGENLVNTVQLALAWDKTKFDIEFTPSAAFPQVLKGPDQTADGMTITLNIGADVTKAIKTTTDVGTITIKPLTNSGGSVITLDINPTGTKVYSLATTTDGVTENVYNAAGSSALRLSIVAKDCSGATTTPTPTLAQSTSPTPTIAAGVPSPTVPIATNQSPACLTLTASTPSGAAPLSTTLTATGSDPNGTITKATFNFGDSSQQDVTVGMGTASVSAQLAHTYNTGGNFTATVVFTDNNGAVSASCSKPIAVTGAFATLPPTIAPSPTATTPPVVIDPPQATPTIAPSGSIGQMVGVVGGIILVITAGIFLLTL